MPNTLARRTMSAERVAAASGAGADLDLPVVHPGLVGGLGRGGGAPQYRPVREVEAAAMPGAGHPQAVDVAFVQRSTRVVADIRKGADLPGEAVEQDLVAVGRDVLRLPLTELGVIEHGGP